MLLVYGEPGLGKTSMLTRWATENGALLVTAQPDWTINEMLRQLAGTRPGIPQYHRSSETRAALIGYILQNQSPIVIDEADHVLARSGLIEALRGISDLCQTPTVLVGMTKLQSKLARHAQVASRIADTVMFQPVADSDVLLTCREMAEVQISRELALELARQAQGRMRLVLNGIARIEQFARVNGLAEVHLEDMRGAELAHDWQAARARAAR
ncbi:AAA family ATPase [Chitiniphilus eburneus]|uniref:AAA family ATPase n=1 Tax=Chitiniphilus eburneus TaxID=2571148 RepID=UPI0035CF699A